MWAGVTSAFFILGGIMKQSCAKILPFPKSELVRDRESILLKTLSAKNIRQELKELFVLIEEIEYLEERIQYPRNKRTGKPLTKKTIQNLRSKVRNHKHAAIECWKNLKDITMFDDELFSLSKFIINQGHNDCEGVRAYAKLLVDFTFYGFNIFIYNYQNAL